MNDILLSKIDFILKTGLNKNYNLIEKDTENQKLVFSIFGFTFTIKSEPNNFVVLNSSINFNPIVDLISLAISIALRNTNPTCI